jgi:8-oxo-dGTP diphosphatase
MIDVVCGVVCNEKGEYLITQRGDSEYYGKWEFPGGKVQKDETYFESIVRELNEELNIEVNPTKEIINYPFKRFNLIFILCELSYTKKKDLRLSEHLDFKWIKIQEISTFNFMDGDYMFIEEHLMRI